LANQSTYAQSVTATLSGTVEDLTGSVVPNVKITVINPSINRQYHMFTDSEGNFTFASLAPGLYTVTARCDGFAPVDIKDVVLNVNDRKAIKIKLQVGAVGEVVDVDGASLTRTDAAVGTVVNRQFIENLPLNGRSFQSLITLTPGVVLSQVTSNASPGQFSVNGQRTNANYFSVDGVSANIGVSVDHNIGQQNSGSVPALTSFGGTNNLVSVDALEEFKIQTSTYAPEFGRQPGGQISLITRSGTNEFHGSLFEYFRNDVLDANDWFNNRSGLEKAPLRQNQFGGVFGGPIFLPRFGEGTPPLYNGRNKTFFFFSYEGLRLRLPQTSVTTVPSLRLREQAAPALRPILNTFPLPTGLEYLGANGEPNGVAPLTSTYSNSQELDATSFRLDHHISDKLILFGRYNISPSSNTSRLSSNLGQSRTTKISTQTFTMGATATLSSTLTNEFRANYSNNRGLSVYNPADGFGGAVPIDSSQLLPPFSSPASGYFSARFIIPGLESQYYSIGILGNSYQRQVNITDNITFLTGKHQYKFGVDYRRLAPIYGPADYVQNVQFNSEDHIKRSVASDSYITTYQGAQPLFTNFSAFAQDTWKILQRLTLTYGLRWELNPPPGEANGKKPVNVIGLDNLAAATLAPTDSPLYNTTYRNFAPRLGLAYQLSQVNGRETTLRAGFGMFYDLGNGPTTQGFFGYPFSSENRRPNIQFPIPPDLSHTVPFPQVGLPITSPVRSIDSNLKLPYTLQWSIAIERALGNHQTVTASYVAAAGRRLLTSRTFNNPIVGRRPNPLFSLIYFTTNQATSDYHSLQVQFQRRLSRDLQALVNYTWSHAIDEVSDESINSNILRGNSAFDVRHNFSTTFTYNLPTPLLGRLITPVFRDWSIDGIVRAQSGAPTSIISGTLIDEFGREITIRPDLVLGTPIYIDGPDAPGGKRLNKNAFQLAPAGQQGSLGRNTVRQLPISQIDLALHRQFMLTELVSLRFRGEAFNLLNTPNFAGFFNDLNNSSLFGQNTSMLSRSLGGLSALYQVGGPRSLQFSLKLIF
jgi:hypothetical protein